MICPYCGNDKTYVYGSRPGFTQKRYRECPKCKQTFITKEVPVSNLYMVEYIEYLKEIGELGESEYKTAISKDSKNLV